MSEPVSKLIADIKEQVLYLQELGVESFDVQLPSAAAVTKSSRQNAVPIAASLVEPSAPPDRSAVKSQPPARSTAGSRLAALPSLAKRTPAPPRMPALSDALNAPASVKETENEASIFGDMSLTLGETADTIESIRAEIGNCTRCALHTGRKQIVHSTGNFNAELMFVGEAPGADEDEQGFPFVGRGGQLLTKIIESIGMSRDEVFIGNINRCRPPGNRAPEPDETAACRPFILREVAVIKPKAIVVLGATAAHNLLQVKTPISKLRGNFHEYFGVKVMPTFHPAYLLRDPHKKREVWEDMKMVRELLNKN